MRRVSRIPAKLPSARPQPPDRKILPKAPKAAPKPPARARRKFAPGEYVRIVPLHSPKPVVSAAELAGTQDVFDGRPQLPAPTAHLTYRGGPLLTNVRVFTIFWGRQWSSSPSARPLMAKINQFFTDIVASPLMDALAEYSVPGKTIGHGQFIGTQVIEPPVAVSSVTDSEIRGLLAAWIKAKKVPPSTRDTLYFIYLEPGVVSIMGGSKSCQNFCGYHDRFGATYYGVMPYPTCSGCLGGIAAFDALTETSSHELCEAITDPVPGKGWYDDRNGEIGDICSWSSKKVGAYTVQLEWSNTKGKCA
jgi:hypothetical protein